ncbi:hypothetical protein GCM10027030_10660 [Luteococcus sediminum]
MTIMESRPYTDPAVHQAGPSLGRAVLVEARTLTGTRSQRAVAAGGLFAMAAFAGGRALQPLAETTTSQLVAMACGPAGWMMLVLAVLLVSQEFSHGTIEQSLLADPDRSRLVLAKALAVLAADAVAFLVAVLMGAGAALVAPLLTGAPVLWRWDAGQLALAAGSLVFTSLAALAWALVSRSAPAPIMVLLLWPTIALLLSAVSSQVAAVLGWVNLDAVWVLADPTPGAWARLASSMLVWIVLPAGLGAWRLVKGDL